MDSAQFSSDSPGRLVPTPLGVPGFVPNPLPPNVLPDSETIRLLEKAQLAIGELKGIGSVVPNPELVAGPLMSREARYSSEIEGTYASVEDLALFGANLQLLRPNPDAPEVWRYRQALQAGLMRLNTDPPGLEMLRTLHRHLFDPRRAPWKTPGEFRTIQNRIGTEGEPPEKARFVPPPSSEMMDALDALMAHVNSDDTQPALVRLSLIHYQFEAIHPFVDGNGRIGRLLIVVLLAHWKLLPHPYLQLSEYFAKNKSAYANHLLWVSQRGAWLEWIKFFVNAIAVQATDAVSRARRLWELREDYRRRVEKSGASARLSRLVDELFRQQVLWASGVASLLGVSPPTALGYLKKLEGVGIVSALGPVHSMSPGRPSMAFAATEIFNLSR